MALYTVVPLTGNSESRGGIISGRERGSLLKRRLEMKGKPLPCSFLVGPARAWIPSFGIYSVASQVESQLNELQIEPLSRRGGGSCSWTSRTACWVHLGRFSMLADIGNEETQPCTPALFSRQEKVSIHNGWDLWPGRMSRLVSGQRSKGQSAIERKNLDSHL